MSSGACRIRDRLAWGVPVPDVDVAGAHGVRLLRKSARERRVLEHGVDSHVLAGLQVGADAQDQAGVRLQLVFVHVTPHLGEGRQ